MNATSHVYQVSVRSANKTSRGGARVTEIRRILIQHLNAAAATNNGIGIAFSPYKVQLT